MKVLVDMNLSPRWGTTLSDSGIPAVHWSTVRPRNAPDAEIMAYAQAHGLVVLTHDLDFGSMLAATQGAKPSVVQLRAQYLSPDAIGTQVISALRQMETEIEEGALLTVDPERTRVRILPLRRGS